MQAFPLLHQYVPDPPIRHQWPVELPATHGPSLTEPFRAAKQQTALAI